MRNTRPREIVHGRNSPLRSDPMLSAPLPYSPKASAKSPSHGIESALSTFRDELLYSSADYDKA